MTFAELFDEIAKIKVLDFLSDHPDQKYSWADIKKHVVTIRTNRAALTKLIDAGIVKQRVIGSHGFYQINADNDIVKAVLKHDFKEGKKAADKEAKRK